jgi:hypothetical protein
LQEVAHAASDPDCALATNPIRGWSMSGPIVFRLRAFALRLSPGGVAPLNLSDDSGCQRGSYRLHDLVFRGEPGFAFLRDHVIVHADGELAAGAFDHGRIDTRR